MIRDDIDVSPPERVLGSQQTTEPDEYICSAATGMRRFFMTFSYRWRKIAATDNDYAVWRFRAGEAAIGREAVVVVVVKHP
jgi:hypothetical protein